MRRKSLPLLFFVFSFYSLILFNSCSNSDAGILSVTPFVVFDYKEGKEVPDVSLAVFIESEHEIQRAQSLKVKKLMSNLSWFVGEPVYFAGTSKKWVGYPSLVPPEGQIIENGTYEVVYTDAAGTEAKSTFMISYKEKLLESKWEDIARNSSVNIVETCALYDKDMNMLYYGTKKKNWNNNDSIIRDYNRAAFIRNFKSTSTGSLFFKKSVESLKDDKKAGETSEN